MTDNEIFALIDRIDDTIVALLKERISHVATLRLRSHMPIRIEDRAREFAIFDRLCKKNPSLNEADVQMLSRYLVETCRRY